MIISPPVPPVPLVLLVLLGMCQKGTIPLDSVGLVQAQNCQVRLTHALVPLMG